MTTGKGPSGSDRVRKLWTILHVKAREEPDRRFHALIDKVWRMDFPTEAWATVRRNGGSIGVDGEMSGTLRRLEWKRGTGTARKPPDNSHSPHLRQGAPFPDATFWLNGTG